MPCSHNPSPQSAPYALHGCCRRWHAACSCPLRVELTAFVEVLEHGAFHRRKVMKTRIVIAAFACVTTVFQFVSTVTVLYI